MRNLRASSPMLAAALALALAATACQTMHFDYVEGVADDRSNEFSEWHHDGILRLVEFSQPVDLQDRCSGQPPRSHTVKRSFLNGIASGISYGLYDGWTVEIDCP